MVVSFAEQIISIIDLNFAMVIVIHVGAASQHLHRMESEPLATTMKFPSFKTF